MKSVSDIFDMLDGWMNFPNYQLERRADIYFARYLPLIFEKRFGETVSHSQIIPEFPLKKEPSRHSAKVDYAVFCKETVYLVELKTNMLSRSPVQDRYLNKATKTPLPKLIDNIRAISTKTKQKTKYKFLLDRLNDLGATDKSIGAQILLVYIQPQNPENDKNTVTFDEVTNYLSGINDPTAKRFCQSLHLWQNA